MFKIGEIVKNMTTGADFLIARIDRKAKMLITNTDRAISFDQAQKTGRHAPLYPVVIRIEIETGQPCAFFSYGTANVGHIECYAHIGQHSEASIDYYHNGTRPINRFNRLTSGQDQAVTALKFELEQIYSDTVNDDEAVSIVWRTRL